MTKELKTAVLDLEASAIRDTASSVSARVVKYLVVEQTSRASSMRVAMETPGGRPTATYDASLPFSVAKAKLAAALSEARKDLRNEWSASIKQATDEIGAKSSQLVTGNQPVVVTQRVPEAGVEALEKELQKIDNTFSLSICKKAHLEQVPALCGNLNEHVIRTPYVFEYQKCNNPSCCSAKRTPPEFRKLAFQRQPTLRENESRKGHFYSRSEALAMVKDQSTYSDLTDLPSNKMDPNKEEARKKARRDEHPSDAAGLRSWEGKR